MNRALATILACALMVLPSAAQRTPSPTPDTSDRPGIDVDAYMVEITLSPDQNQLRGVADVRFRQLERMSYVTFDLDSRLRIDRVTLNGTDLRFRQFDFDSTLEVTLNTPQPDFTTLRFEYSGYLDPSADRRQPVLASVGAAGAVLLYDGKWFPTNSLYKDKAAMSVRVNAPAEWKVVADMAAVEGGTGVAFASETPSYWGTVVAGKFTSTPVTAGSSKITAHTLTAEEAAVQKIAETAGKALEFFTQTFGSPPSSTFQIIEVPDVNWTSKWSPGVLLMAANQFRSDLDMVALTRSMAHQWFPLKISVADPQRDAWMVDGLAVFSTLLYAEKNLSPAEAQEQVDKALVKALSSDDAISVREAGKLERDSADYHALVEYKGAYIFRMLQWVVGEEKFDQILSQYVERFQNTPASTEAFARLASEVSGQDLEFFFDQWLNDSEVPEMETEWIVRRVKNGYQIDGEIQQDLDLFRMPVELEVETDAEPDYKRVDVSGQASEFSVVTERKPKTVNIDPHKRLLRISPDIKVAISINRGEELMNEGRFNDAMDEFQDAIDADARNSLASFRMGEALFEVGNLNPAASNFRNAISGNLKPKWVEVWSYINLGKIYDIRGDRDRALGEYQKAINTGDDSFGAQADAQKYIEKAFRRGVQP